MSVTKEQYEDALDVLHEHLPYQVQRQDTDTGEWKNVGQCVRGKSAAYEELNALKDADDEAVLRALPKNEADKYREGVVMGRKLAAEDAEPARPRRPQMYMPDNL